MSEIKNIQLPDIGDFDEVEVIEILVSVGDTIKADDSIITLESDKASMEIPAPWVGVVTEINIALGDKIKQGDVLLALQTEEDSVATSEESIAEVMLSSADNSSPALTKTSITSTSSKSPISGTITGMIFGKQPRHSHQRHKP
jgi:pyruvate/2-oxoglutarate dehydrogenase complex dihydrolipoamide acyltransferase (E2) component